MKIKMLQSARALARRTSDLGGMRSRPVQSGSVSKDKDAPGVAMAKPKAKAAEVDGEQDPEEEEEEGVMKLTQESSSIEEEEEKEEKRRSKRRSQAQSKRMSLSSIQEISEMLKEQPMIGDRIKEEDESKKIVEEDEEEEENQEGAESSLSSSSFNILKKLTKEKHRKLLLLVCKFLPVRQMVEVSFLSKAHLKAVANMPLCLQYYRTVVDFRVLERVFNEYYQNNRMTPWKVGGLYTSINDLNTLFQIIDPEGLDFLGVVNPNMKTIQPVKRCKNLKRFELHGCEQQISLQPLLELKDTLLGVSILACSQITDVTIIERLPKLRVVSLFKSKNVARLPNLERCPDIRLLSLGECAQIPDVRCITSLSKLRVLDLSHVQAIKSLDFLKNANRLRILILDHCKGLESLDGLESFGENLQVLRLNGIMGLPSIEGVQHCPNLTSLEMGELILVKDLSPLQACPKLQDLLLLNCASIATLEDLKHCQSNIKRLVISGCKKLTSEEDAEFINGCQSLAVFGCENIDPAFLTMLMYSTKYIVLVNVESQLISVTEEQFKEKAYPVVLRKFISASEEKAQISAFRVVQAYSILAFALSHMVSEGMLNRMFEMVQDEAFKAKEISLTTKMEIIRTFTVMSRSPKTIELMAELEGSLEFLVNCIVVPNQRSSARDRQELKDNLLVENLSAEAARALALLLEKEEVRLSGETQPKVAPEVHEAIVDRLLKQRTLQRLSKIIMQSHTMDATRQPMLLVIFRLLQAKPELVETMKHSDGKPFVHDQLVPAVLQAIIGGTFTSQSVGLLVLTEVMKQTKSEDLATVTMGRIFDTPKAIDTFATLIGKGSTGSQTPAILAGEIRKRVVAFFKYTPEEFYMDLMTAPGIITGVIQGMADEYNKSNQQVTLFFGITLMGAPVDNEFLMDCSQLIEKLSVDPDLVKMFIAEETSSVSQQTLRATKKIMDKKKKNAASRLSSLRKRISKRFSKRVSKVEEDNQTFYEAMTEPEQQPQDDDEDDFVTAVTSGSIGAVEEDDSNNEDGDDSNKTKEEKEPKSSFRGIICENLANIFAVGLTKGSVRGTASMCRVMMNFINGSPAFETTISTIFTSKNILVENLIPLVVRCVEAIDAAKLTPNAQEMEAVALQDVHSCLKLIQFFARNPKLHPALGKLNATSFAPFAQHMVRLIETDMVDLAVLSSVVDSLLRSPASKLAMDAIVNPTVVHIDRPKKSALKLLVSHLFDRKKRGLRESEKLLKDEKERDEVQLQKKRQALIFLSTLIVQHGSHQGATCLNSHKRTECLFLDMNDPDASIHESSILLVHHIIRNKFKESAPHYGKMGKELLTLFDQHQHYGVQCINRLLMAGSTIGRVSAVRLLALLVQNDAFAKVVLSFEEAPASSSSDEGESEEPEQEQGQEEKAEEDAAKKDEHRERKSTINSTAASLVPPLGEDDSTSVLLSLFEYILDPNPALDLEPVCMVVMSLAKIGEEFVEKRVVAPLLHALDSMDDNDEPLSFERVVSAIIFLSNQTSIVGSAAPTLTEGDSHTPASGGAVMKMLERGDVLQALAKSFCSTVDDKTSHDTHQSIRAIANFVKNDPEKLLVLDQGSNGGFTKQLVRQLQEGDHATKQAIFEMLRPVLLMNKSDEENLDLAKKLVDHGLLDILIDWQQNIISNGFEVSDMDEIELGRILLKPVVIVSNNDEKVQEQLSEIKLFDLFVKLYMNDTRQKMRHLSSQLLVDLDENFLLDNSNIFQESFASKPGFEERLANELDFERKQLEQYPVSFQRVRGFPFTYEYEDISRIFVKEWSTIAIQNAPDSIKGKATFFHRQLYYEIELYEFSSKSSFGWISDQFQNGVLQGLSQNGVGDEPTSSWGIKANFNKEWKQNDVLGFAADLDENTLTFTLNGKPVFFQKIPHQKKLFPAFTANVLEAELNFGRKPFRFSPPNRSFRSIYASIKYE